jgi:hypothetical protein
MGTMHNASLRCPHSAGSCANDLPNWPVICFNSHRRTRWESLPVTTVDVKHVVIPVDPPHLDKLIEGFRMSSSTASTGDRSCSTCHCHARHSCLQPLPSWQGNTRCSWLLQTLHLAPTCCTADTIYACCREACVEGLCPC